MAGGDLGGQFALDLQGLDRLKQTARQDPSTGVKEVGRQFEALFLQMMLKSMRQASPKSGLLDSQQTQFYNGLLDQQWAQHLAGRGVGLAEQLTQQLRRQAGIADDAQSVAGVARGVPRQLYGAVPVSAAGDAAGVVGRRSGDDFRPSGRSGCHHHHLYRPFVAAADRRAHLG